MVKRFPAEVMRIRRTVMNETGVELAPRDIEENARMVVCSHCQSGGLAIARDVAGRWIDPPDQKCPHCKEGTCRVRKPGSDGSSA